MKIKDLISGDLERMRAVERDNRATGDFDAADLAREIADAQDARCALMQRMTLRRFLRHVVSATYEKWEAER